MAIWGMRPFPPTVAPSRPSPLPVVPSPVRTAGPTLADRLGLRLARQGTVPAQGVPPFALLRPEPVAGGSGRHQVAAGASAAAAGAIAQFDGTAWAGTLPANGGRDVTVLVPRGLDPQRPVELMVYFHGNGGSAASSTRELRSLIEGLPGQGRNAIVVIPASSGRGSDPTWMNPANGESLTALQDQAQSIAERLTGRRVAVGRYTVAGFSGGGKPLATAAKAGQLRADHVNLFDSTYGDWGDTVARLRRPGTTVNAFYTAHNQERAARLQGLPGVRVEAAGTSHGGTPSRHFYR